MARGRRGTRRHEPVRLRRVERSVYGVSQRAVERSHLDVGYVADRALAHQPGRIADVDHRVRGAAPLVSGRRGLFAGRCGALARPPVEPAVFAGIPARIAAERPAELDRRHAPVHRATGRAGRRRRAAGLAVARVLPSDRPYAAHAECGDLRQRQIPVHRPLQRDGRAALHDRAQDHQPDRAAGYRQRDVQRSEQLVVAVVGIVAARGQRATAPDQTPGARRPGTSRPNMRSAAMCARISAKRAASARAATTATRIRRARCRPCRRST